MRCFNPLQVRYKLTSPRKNGKKLYCFNPLQVRYKQGRSFPQGNLGGRVSIPYRYATNLPSFFCFPFSQAFQSLIGTLQTIFLPSFLHPKLPVSIPYRYATNMYQVTGEWRFFPRFQSLIGTLQTYYEAEFTAGVDEGFNPLQVRYKLFPCIALNF